MQILFWFNPLIYFIKHSIKLNHEFLADNAVLKQGIASSTYQNTLLAFSSNAAEPKLANAINYSSIKKRFTVMKTHTSKQAFWLRNLILLPLLAILIYSFSEKRVIEKPHGYQMVDDEIKVLISKDKKVIIGNETIDFNSISDKLIELTKNSKIKLLVSIEIEAHLSMEYLEEIKSELEKTNLKISMVRSNSMFLDRNIYKKETRDYFKGIPFSGDTLAIITEKNELIFGISAPKYFTNEEINAIQKSFSKKYNIKQNNDKESHRIMGIKDSLNPNPFSITISE